MRPEIAIMLHVSFVGFSLVMLSLLVFVPFYRTLVGWVMFIVHLDFWLMTFLTVLIFHGLERYGIVANSMRSASICSVACALKSLIFIIIFSFC